MKEYMDAQQSRQPTIGSLFAGIGGFDAGFEQAGFKTAWQVEISDVCRAVLADRFPHAKQFTDVQTCLPELWRVDVIVGGFPCQDVSIMGKRKGLAGARTGLFFDAINIINALRPEWVVLENVTGLLNSNDGRDFQTVIQSLAECGYMGAWRVLDARYFGVPTARRRVFVVAGLGKTAPAEFMVDAGPVARMAGKSKAESRWANAHRTLLTGIGPGCIDLGGSNLIAEANGWDSMVERERTVADNGFLKGLDEANHSEVRASGNAVCPPVAKWIAEKIISTF